MRLKKKWLAAALVLAAVWGTAPFRGAELPTVSAASSQAQEKVSAGQCGDNLTWTLDNNTGVLTVSGQGKMWSRSEKGDSFWSNDAVKSVVIKDGVTSIGEGAFCYGQIKEFTMPDSVKSVGKEAFYYCTALESLTLSNSLTDIGDFAFFLCSNLESVTLPNSLAKIGSQAFYRCVKLTDVTLPASVTSVGDSAFGYCTNMTDIEVKNGNPNYASENGALLNAKKTALIFVPAGKKGYYAIPDTVTTIGRTAFADCGGISAVTIPPSVTVIEDFAFEYCGITAFTVPSSVTAIGEKAFMECFDLKKIVIPQSVQSIGAYCFYGCWQLTDICYTGTDEQWAALTGHIRTGLEYGLNYHWNYQSDPVMILVQPSDAAVPYGEKASFRVKAAGSNLTYQWQLSDDGWQTWRNSSVKTAEYTVAVTEKNNGRYVRCIVTDAYGDSVTSSPAKMSLDGIGFLRQPWFCKADLGDTVRFDVEAFGEAPLTYQWQLSDDGGRTWRNSSVKTATYWTTLTVKNDGRFVRCRVTDATGAQAVSDAVSMNVWHAVIVTQPTDSAAKLGGKVSFRVRALGDIASYNWQLSDDGGKTWRNSAVKTDCYETILTENHIGRRVRCRVFDMYGNVVISDAAVMKCKGTAITVQPTDSTARLGGTVAFKVKAVGEGLTYQWQLSDDEGKTWRNSSVKTANYAVILTEKNTGRYVRCIVTDRDGNIVTSKAAVMKRK